MHSAPLEVIRMEVTLPRFAETLRELLACSTADAVEDAWRRSCPDDVGWGALASVERSTDPAVAPLLDETDGLLLRLLDRLPPAARSGRAGVRVRRFRLPTLERLQHATAASLVAHRFGPAGLAAVASDASAPIARRYHAFLLLARLHARTTWPLFERFLVPEAHHAFLGVAAEAARYYPGVRPARHLVLLFEAVRTDVHLRAFLSPRLLATLFVLADAVALPLYDDLAICGHTSADPERCEVTHALVMLRRLTGMVPPNTKFPEASGEVDQRLDEAEACYRADRDVLHPVAFL
jgi:hypothetical protein